MEFSRLADTSFPNLETASPYALRNTFDYTRWVADTRVHLVNVLWGNDYKNVVDFESDEARDEWFDSMSSSYVLTLKANARALPGGVMKLPIPFDVATRYNYLYVEVPVATSSDVMIDYESKSGIRRWYFFVDDIRYSAPNTTEFTIEPDIWVNFHARSCVKYMMLSRGHAPVAYSDTDEYLADPVSNNRYLLAPDVTFDDSSVVRDSEFVPFGNGAKFVCVATTCSYEQLSSGAYGVAYDDGSSWGDPTYSDTSDWYGYQLQVDGYGFGDSLNYSKVSVPTSSQARCGNVIPNGLSVIAVRASDSTFLDDVRDDAPGFLRSIRGLFVVDEGMITLGDEVTIAGHSCRMCSGMERDVTEFPLDKGMFGFDADEQRFAKLYTYPYSRIEVSDDDGRTVEVRIENTGRIGLRLMTSVAFPTLNCRVFLTGINGVGSQSYQWKRMDGSDWERTCPSGDWDKLTFELGIPTYAIYMDGTTAYRMDHWSSVENERRRALNGYHNSVRSANLAYANGNATATNARDCTIAEADTAQENSVASADTAQSNANDSSDTALANSNANATTQQTNTNNAATCALNNMDATIAANSANTASANSTASSNTKIQNHHAGHAVASRNFMAIETTETQNETSIMTSGNSALANVSSSAINTAYSGAMSGIYNPVGVVLGGAVGGVVGAASAAVTGAAAVGNAMIAAQCSSAVTDAEITSNYEIQTDAVNSADSVTTNENTNRTTQTDNTNSCLGTQRDNNYSTATQNATNSYNTQTSNASRTNSMERGNASRTHDTAVSNADRTHGTVTGNAANTYATQTSNNSRTREVAVLNAKETLETARDTASSAWYDASRRAPVQLTQYGGDATRDALGTKGLQFRVRTQPDSAIAQAASQFARYGYALNQVWDVGKSGLSLMRNFTYWEASDIWVDVRDEESADVASTIAGMFRSGITVWSDPDKIGKVSIYDN